MKHMHHLELADRDNEGRHGEPGPVPNVQRKGALVERTRRSHVPRAHRVVIPSDNRHAAQYSTPTVPLAKDEVEVPNFAGWRVVDLEEQLVNGEVVAAVAFLVLREIQLGGQGCALGPLDFHVDVRGPIYLAGLTIRRGQKVVILRRDHRFQAVASIGAGELMSAQAVALVVVIGRPVSMPEIQPRTFDRFARLVVYGPNNGDGFANSIRFSQVRALWRKRLPVGSFDLCWCQRLDGTVS